ncbi:unnamed protein product [Caenorhabditis sp. 36 PRJEB53466]|nr:unnamed protein product [Caenorhabditis sp. 36 PRJEB53466]
MTSSSDSEDERHLPYAYRSRKRRDSSYSSSETHSDSSEDERKRQRRRREGKDKKLKKRKRRDKPMWKEEGEISDDRESINNSESFSDRSRSRSRDRRRKRRSEWRRGERRTGRRTEETADAIRCKECGCRHYSVKALIHHEMSEHDLNAQCHLCLQKFETRKKIREHYELEHTQEVVKCIFCKSSFDQPLEMNEGRWDDYFSHIYGEIFYSRLAETEQQ